MRNPVLPTLLAKLTALLSKSDPDQIADLNDTLDLADSTAAKDLWNSGNHRVPGQAENPIGPNEQMAGGRGTDQFAAQYMDGGDAAVSRNNSSPTAMLGEMVSRQTKLEKSVAALAAAVAIMLKADSDEDADDEEGSEEDDRDEVEKAEGPASMSLADAFSFLGPKLSKRAEAAAKAVEAKAARAKAARGVATPPSMNPAGRAVMKAQHQIIAEELDNDAAGMTMAERITLRLRANTSRMLSEGAAIADTDLRARRTPGFYPTF